jgi:hypothetical protein
MRHRGQFAGEQAERLARRPVGQRVDVVEGDDEVVGYRVDDLVAERAHLVLGAALQREPGAEAGKPLGEARRQVGEEQRRVRQPVVAGAPDPRALAARLRLGEERALAVPGAGEDRHDRSRQAVKHAVDEIRSGQAARRQTRRQQARAQHAGGARYRGARGCAAGRRQG